MKLSERIESYEARFMKKDLVMEFGDKHDGAIEFAGIVEGGAIEVGYFYGDIKPKNILVLSSQVGCPARCAFCELGSETFVRNLHADEIYEQAVVMLQQAKRYGIDIDGIGHKVNMAKSGEPLFNRDLIAGMEKLSGLGCSFKISTVFPVSGMKNFAAVTDFAASYHLPVQIQISLISTSEEERRKMAGIRVASFDEIKQAGDYWRSHNPRGRKINLSLMLTEEMACDAAVMHPIFHPDNFRFRFRNYVPTEHGKARGLETISEKKYRAVYDSFSAEGYEVGTWATPTPIEQRFNLASNVTRSRYLRMIQGNF